MVARQHEVAIVTGGQQVGGWTSYSIETSLLEPADAFTLVRPVSKLAWEACETDAPVTVTVDGVPVVSGFVGSLEASASEGTMTLAGRCRVGRLVDESAPGIQYGQLKMKALLRELVGPWFTEVRLSNATDRKLRRGKGYLAPAPSEPVVLDLLAPGGRIQPGMARWAAIEEIVTAAGYLAWGSADGKALIVGLPNYNGQEVQWSLVHAADRQGTVLDLTYTESIEDCYSQIQVLASGRGTDVNYGTAASDRAGVWRDGPGPDGIGVDFLRPKRLVLSQPKAARDAAEAGRYAEREARRRNQSRRRLQVEARGHGQLVRGGTPTIFAPDTLARCVYEPIGLDGVYLVVGCKYHSQRNTGERTTLTLVPRGTGLSL